ncbi:hypothetical protein [Streptomyces sp. NBC_01174]|uniref:hypothetical protein n=1 Tax=Streptomyces sp. NBC_01174 TaxID=2903758 RepID=UPI003870B6E3|nr:hypothetical protein OG284_03890 [Streptomyces sp. NBC_01177]WSS74441.1 hypothetical protein OG414_03920 [Streptomyces sp. NBC_01174]
MRFRQHPFTRLALGVAALGLAMSAIGPAFSAPSAPGPPSAPPLMGVEVVKTTQSVPDYRQVRTFCPEGKAMISGGAEATVPHSGYDSVVLVSSYAEFYPDGTAMWVASARNYAGEPSTVTAWAICAWKPSGYEVVEAPLSQVPVDQPVTVPCPAGKVALGGGGEIQGHRSSLTKSAPTAFNSAKQPTQWVVAGTTEASRTVGVVASAMCADPITDVTWSTGRATSNSPAGGFLVCPDGRQVVGGGASASGPESVLISSKPGLESEGARSDGWWAQAGSIYEPLTADVYVTCATR